MAKPFPAEDITKLVEAVSTVICEVKKSEQATMGTILEAVNWDFIAEEVFKGVYSPSDCIFEFLKLPIAESLKLDFESQAPVQQKPIGTDSIPLNRGPASASVFMDASNPLLSQVAIFARLLETSKNKRELFKEENDEVADEVVRTTRGASKKKEA